MDSLKKTITAFIVIIIIGCGFIISDKIFNTTKAKKQYRQAVEFLNKNDLENSFYNFSKISKYSILFEPALFHQLEISYDLKDYQTAIEKGNLFVKKFPQSTLITNAKYYLAKSYFCINRFEEAKNIFENLNKKNDENDYTIASNYFLANIYNTDKQKAKKYYLTYLEKSPTGKFYINSINELNKLKVPLSNTENLIIAKAFFENRNYDKALNYLNLSTEKDAWAYMTITYHNLGQTKKANSIFNKGFIYYSKITNEDILRRAIDLYVKSLGLENKEAWKNVLNISDKNNSQGRDYILYRLSKYLPKKEKYEIVKQIYEKYPDGNFASEALWEMFWYDYQNKSYETAKKLGKKHISKYQDTQASPKILFWLGKIALYKRNTSEANGYFNRILTKYPDDYYAFRANAKIKNLSHSFSSENSNTLNTTKEDLQIPIQYSNLDIKDIKFLNILIELGDYKLLNAIDFNSKFIESWIEYKKGNLPAASRIARDELSEMDVKPTYQDVVYKLAYPLEYENEINQYTTKYKEDAYLISAIIREESYFDTKAKSAVGAKGLMQLMPSTASYIAHKYKIYYSSLLNPDENINLGCAYFKYIKNQLNSNDMLAVGAYNGGPNALAKWKDDLKYKDMDEFVENIPYPETQNYIKKVYRSYWNYLNIYE